MQVSQSRPGTPVAGISCSGVPKSPIDPWPRSRPKSPPARPTRLLTMIDRLERPDEVVEILTAPVGPGALPLSVEPHDADRPVVGQQLAHLRLQEAHVPLEVGTRIGPCCRFPVTTRQVVRVVPVHDRVIPADPDSLLRRRARKLFHHVAMERRRHDVEIGFLRVEQREPIVVLRGDDDVLHARLLGQPDPGVGIEFRGVEAGAEPIVLFERDLRGVADPLSVVRPPVPLSRRNGVEAPVDEQAEPRLAPPVEARVGRRGRSLLRPGSAHADSRAGDRQQQQQEAERETATGQAAQHGTGSSRGGARRIIRQTRSRRSAVSRRVPTERRVSRFPGSWRRIRAFRVAYRPQPLVRRLGQARSRTVGPMARRP